MNKLIPIIIGIITVIIGIILTAVLDKQIFFILIIAGIILIIPVKEQTKKFKLFLKSFKINKRISLTLLIDAVYWIIFFVLLTFAKNLIEKKTSALSLINLATAKIGDFTAIKSILIYIIIILIISVILLLIFYSLTKYSIWAVLLKKKLQKKQALKFFFLNLLWWILWLPVIYYLLTGVKSTAIKIITIILMILYVYMTIKLHYTMLKTNSIKKSFAKAIESLALIPNFLPVMAFAVLIYFVILGILAIVTIFTNPGILFHAVLFIIYIVWLRNYLKDYIETFKL